MTVEVKEIFPTTPVADKNGLATLELVEVILRLAESNRELQARVTALEVFHP